MTQGGAGWYQIDTQPRQENSFWPLERWIASFCANRKHRPELTIGICRVAETRSARWSPANLRIRA